MKFVIRPLRCIEYPLLEDFLYDAIFVPKNAVAPPRSIVKQPELSVYVRNFGEQKDDHALAAEVSGDVVGLIWARIMDDYGHIDDDVPSLALAVKKHCRRMGIGTELLREMTKLLQKQGYERVSLSVQRANEAKHLYERAGFETIKENGEELIMVKPLQKAVEADEFQAAALSETYEVRELTEADLWDVFHLCKNNELYYEYCPPQPSLDGIRRDMKALPEGKEFKDKFYIGFYEKGKLIAVMDLIRNYPNEKTYFIGLFMMDALRQGRGIGSKIIEEACRCLRKLGGFSVRLAWVTGNPQAEHFWIKNGFVPILTEGSVKSNIKEEVTVAERIL